MNFEWDDAKWLGNLDKHGIDFFNVRGLFDGRAVVTTRSSFPDEERYLTTGIIDERFICVVWTWRNDAIRIISARRARHGEIRAYQSLHGG